MVCSFCVLVRQIRDDMTARDVELYIAHLKYGHKLQPYEIPA